MSGKDKAHLSPQGRKINVCPSEHDENLTHNKTAAFHSLCAETENAIDAFSLRMNRRMRENDVCLCRRSETKNGTPAKMTFLLNFLYF